MSCLQKILSIHKVALKLFKIARIDLLGLSAAALHRLLFSIFDTMQLCGNRFALLVEDRLNFRSHQRERMGKIAVLVGGVLHVISLVGHR